MNQPSDPDNPLLADGLEKAFIGFGTRFNYGVAVYSTKKVIEILVDRDKMDYQEAREFFDFNIVGGYVGENTPVFMDDLTPWWDETEE